MRRGTALVLAASVLGASIGPAATAEAQKPQAPRAAAPAPAGQPSPARPPAPPPPYEPQLLRLAEILGALTYLRDLCGLGDSADFRAKIAELIESDGLDEERRDLLAGAYNKGFRDYATSYRACGPAAEAVIERYLNETAKLAADLASRYGG